MGFKQIGRRYPIKTHYAASSTKRVTSTSNRLERCCFRCHNNWQHVNESIPGGFLLAILNQTTVVAAAHETPGRLNVGRKFMLEEHRRLEVVLHLLGKVDFRGT